MADKYIRVRDENGEGTTPATDESIILLRRIARLLESQAVVDVNSRQRVAVDNAAATVIGAARIEQSGGMGALFLVDQRYEMIDRAHIAYATSIRSKLIDT